MSDEEKELLKLAQGFQHRLKKIDNNPMYYTLNNNQINAFESTTETLKKAGKVMYTYREFCVANGIRAELASSKERYMSTYNKVISGGW